MKKVYQSTIDVYDKLGKKYLKDSLKGVSPERAHFIENLKPNSTILDLGCGGGRDAKVFAKLGHNVVGVDLSKVMLAGAKKLVPKAKFILADATNLKFPQNFFDAIWAEAVLLHLERTDVPKVIKKLYKILKLGGFAHVFVKKGSGSAYVKEKLSGGQDRFYTYFSKKELIEMFKSAGLKIIYSSIVKDPHGRKGLQWVCMWGRK